MIHIAVDIGASSGRLVIGELNQNRLSVQEVHRFSNGFREIDGTLYWDVDYLLHEILVGLQKIKKAGYKECTVGIDTWAVDYVLLNKSGKRLKEVVSYRDHRTDHSIERFTKKMSKEKIYDLTGIQFLPFNTLYQLYEEDKHVLDQTAQILMIPDYLTYRLTGNISMEPTNASTTQLFDVNTRDLSEQILQEIGLTIDHFAPLVEPGQSLHQLKGDWFTEFDLPHCQVIHVASHDTASAVVGTPGSGENWAFLSSGTWSLLGVETDHPIINNQALLANYTNEWGVFHTYRFLKNIMGMWIIQEIKRSFEYEYDDHDLMLAAKKVDPFQQYIDLNDERFLNPDNMVQEIQDYCQETNQTVPTSPGELASAVYNNLAIIYALEMETLESITNKKIDHLYIVGGGSQNDWLNQLTANFIGKPISIGPTEATAIGNILMQLITIGKINDLQTGRKVIAKSFGLTEFIPQEIRCEEIIEQFKRIT